MLFGHSKAVFETHSWQKYQYKIKDAQTQLETCRICINAGTMVRREYLLKLPNNFNLSNFPAVELLRFKLLLNYNLRLREDWGEKRVNKQ